MAFYAQDRDFEELWGNSTKRYEVPRFQREYTWSTDEVDNLWNDLLTDEDFFLGSIVLNVGNRNQRTEIIDGQQRMLTMTILHSAIRDVAHENGIKDAALLTHSTNIYRTGSFGGGHYIINPAKNLRDYFRRSVQKYPKPNFAKPKSKEEKLVRKNYDFLKKKVKEYIENLTSLDDKKTALGEIHEKMMRMKFIRIEVSDGYDAYRIFETMNARGVELTVADLIKNMIFRQIDLEDDGTDVAKEKWDKIKENLDATQFDIARFVRYHWISSSSTVTARKLYREIKDNTTENGWVDLLDLLVRDSKLLRELTSGEIPNQNRIAVLDNINSDLKEISKLGSIQCYVLLLSIFRNRELLNISWERVRDVTRALERFIFSYHTVCRKPANTVEKYYSQLAIGINKLESDEDSQQRLRSRFAELFTKLEDLRPNREEFIEMFCNIKYTTSTSTKNKIRNILTKIEHHKYPDQIFEHSVNENISIEHLLPQDPVNWGLNDEDVKDFVHSIGNLLLVGIPINRQAKNSTLQEKIPILRGSRILTTQSLIDYLDSKRPLNWDEGEIHKRAKELAELSYDEIWS